MTLTDLLKSLEPKTFETKAFIATSITSIVGALVDNNQNLLLLAPLATLPVYLSLRLVGLSEYLANVRFDNWHEQLSKEEFEKTLKKPVEEKPDISKIPNFYRNKILTLYRFK